MRNQYNFECNRAGITNLAQQNINLAEAVNPKLKDMYPQFLRRIVKELKDQYYEKYLNKQYQDQELIAINSALNLVGREQVTNVDELFQGLASQINSYYCKQEINVKRSAPYFNQCSNCQKYVSNSTYGAQCHTRKCLDKGKNKMNEINKNKKIKDTKEKYEMRQKAYFLSESKQINKQSGEFEQKAKFSKRQTKEIKIQQKLTSHINNDLSWSNISEQEFVDQNSADYENNEGDNIYQEEGHNLKRRKSQSNSSYKFQKTREDLDELQFKKLKQGKNQNEKEQSSEEDDFLRQ